MGLLDDAIREHLELKRRSGADPNEVARQEQEALGPARRGPEPLEVTRPPVAGPEAIDPEAAQLDDDVPEFEPAGHEPEPAVEWEPAEPEPAYEPSLPPRPESSVPEPEPEPEPDPEPRAGARARAEPARRPSRSPSRSTRRHRRSTSPPSPSTPPTSRRPSGDRIPPHRPSRRVGSRRPGRAARAGARAGRGGRAGGDARLPPGDARARPAVVRAASPARLRLRRLTVACRAG